MKVELFEELLKSVKEGGAILRGEVAPSRRFTYAATSIREIREKTHLSQPAFALLIGVSVKTLQNWEQDRRKPNGAAAALFRIIAHNPELALQALHQH